MARARKTSASAIGVHGIQVSVKVGRRNPCKQLHNYNCDPSGTNNENPVTVCREEVCGAMRPRLMNESFIIYFSKSAAALNGGMTHWSSGTFSCWRIGCFLWLPFADKKEQQHTSRNMVGNRNNETNRLICRCPPAGSSSWPPYVVTQP